MLISLYRTEAEPVSVGVMKHCVKHDMEHNPLHLHQKYPTFNQHTHVHVYYRRLLYGNGSLLLQITNTTFQIHRVTICSHCILSILVSPQLNVC